MPTISFNTRKVFSEEAWEEVKNSNPTIIFEDYKEGTEEDKQKMLKNLRKKLEKMCIERSVYL